MTPPVVRYYILPLTVAVAALLSVGAKSQQVVKPASGSYVLYDAAGRHHYELVGVPSAITWNEARVASNGRSYLGMPGYLACINGPEERDFLAAKFHLNGAYLGAYQDRRAPDYREPKGGWRWVSNEPFQFTSWGDKEPNNGPPDEDVTSFADNSRWNDCGAETKTPQYLVEYATAGPDPSAAAGGADETTRLLTEALRGYRSIRSYQAEFEVSFKAFRDTRLAIRGRIYVQTPGRFRLEARGNNGSLLAVSDGRRFVMARTVPGERMKFLVKPMRSLPAAIAEAQSLLMAAPSPPSLTGLITGGVSPQTWTTAARLGPHIEGPAPEVALRSNVQVTFLGEDPLGGDATLKLAGDPLRIVGSEVEFRYKAYPFSARETHRNVEINPRLAPDLFAFQPTDGAEQVDDLGEGDEQVTYGPGKR